jgi:CelD/BcsL family acetyltransferase involved in cellulose biosynthesis
MTVAGIEPVAIDGIGREWSALPVTSIFSTFEWSAAWWRHFGAGRTPLLHVARDEEGAVAAVVPLYLWRERPLRVVRFLGHPQGDELGPVGPAGPAERAAALALALSRIDHDVFVGEQLPGGEDWPSLLHVRRWRREAGPVLRFAGSWDDYLDTRSANFRGQLRRRERRLQQRYVVRFRLTEDESRLDRDLDALFALHRARWGARSGFGPEPFHREIARQALGQGRLRLWVVELDGRAAAAWLGFRFGNVESYYQAGRDPAHDADSLGLVLLAHTIRAALDDGVEEYRFLRGSEPYKSRFTAEDPGLETVVASATARGRGAVSAAVAARFARDRIYRRTSR